MRFRKKPVVIDAMRYEQNASDIIVWANALRARGSKAPPITGGFGKLEIHTLEGVMSAATGDWIIRGVKGEFYPCKADIFDATYEAAE